MRIFNSGKTKRGKDIKSFMREWLEKLVSPGTSDKSKSFKSRKLKFHIHNIKGATARAKGHQESITAATGTPVMTKDGHVHEYSGAVIAGGKETHRIEGVTGASDGKDRDHTHKITGRTSKDGNHAHKYNIETSKAVEKQAKGRRRGSRKEKAASSCATLPVTTK